MDLPKRKNIRLKEYDYSSPGVYFVTVCASERKKYFWNSEKCVVPILKYDEVVLSEIGKEVEIAINGITEHYQNVSVDKFVIMPNHIHLMIRINSTEDGRPMVAPTISRVIQQMKGFVSKRVGFSIWQKRFYDHVIRNQKDYNEKWEYIENNPVNWERDDFYVD